jgi:hypothetical protein
MAASYAHQFGVCGGGGDLYITSASYASIFFIHTLLSKGKYNPAMKTFVLPNYFIVFISVLLL